MQQPEGITAIVEGKIEQIHRQLRLIIVPLRFGFLQDHRLQISVFAELARHGQYLGMELVLLDASDQGLKQWGGSHELLALF